MNYLFTYIRLLSPRELHLLGSLALAPREREVLDALTALRGTAEPDRASLLAGLAIAPSFFDKTCSVLLRRVYEAVVPAGGVALLADLNSRGLYAGFRHEFRRQEKRLADADRDVRADFYMACFTIMGHAARDAYDRTLMASIARRYSLLRPSPDNTVYFEACMISRAIWEAAAHGANREARPRLGRRLAANAARITETTGALATYRHHQAAALYHAQIDEQPHERLKALETAAALCRRNPGLVSREEMVLTECRIAESHYFNSRRFEQARRLYARLFRRHATVLARDYYHTTKFIQLSIICGRFAHAERLLRARFELHLQGGHQSIGTMGAISWAKLLLASGRAAEAKPYIDFGVRHNRKNFFVQYEIELRMLETIYFAVVGNDEFVERLAERNVKYLRSRGFTLATSRYYPWLFKLLVAFIDERERGLPLPGVLTAKLAEFDEGPAALYGTLLRMVRSGAGDDAGATTGARADADRPASAHGAPPTGRDAWTPRRTAPAAVTTQRVRRDRLGRQ